MPVLDADKVLVEKYASDFSIPRELAEIIFRRFPEYSEARRFLFPSIDHLHDPRTIPDITVAAHEIIGTIKKGEGILIYTHDDVDGYTAAAVVYKALTDITRGSGTVHVYPIVREKDGYILNPRILRNYHEKGVKLLLTVDFGISNEENPRIAAQEGMRVVICDHHETRLTKFTVPSVDPKRRDSEYPFRELAGVGVAFKLAQFLYSEFFRMNAHEFYSLKKNFFPIVCVGTIADRVVLRNENRIFCAHGMELMNKIEDAWALCLHEDGAVDVNRLIREVVPTIGSAAYNDPALGIEFFVQKNLARVRECYKELKQTDQKRREEIDTLFSEVVTNAEVNSRFVLSLVPLSKQHYLGSIAARLRDYFKRNSLIIGIRDDKCIGELRSCDIDLYKLLYGMRRFFLDFGGHQKAAGFSMGKNNLEAFLDEVKDHLQNRQPDIANGCEPQICEPEALVRRSDVGMLKMLMPFGEGNPAPVLTDGVSAFTVDNSLNLIDKG
ncbi:MAG: DHH family phosphoesterase [candidate division WOR-3 bacterium]|nr:MAG: DHH family phosphoesterase [candidate division WOR-3 bacterium]